MKLSISKTNELKGTIKIPGSKSHTIRALIISALAYGDSKILNPLASADTKAALNGIKALGAIVNQENSEEWQIKGFGKNPINPDQKLDMLNSGTSTNLLTGIAALTPFEIHIDGDASLRARTVKPLLDALFDLGVNSSSVDGKPPLKIQGPMKGGKTKVLAKSSQFVSSLLISCPLAEADTEIGVLEPCEIPYIEMTLKWLDEQGINYERQNFEYFKIYGNQSYKGFEKKIPADWSSAAFPLVAAAITNSEITIIGPEYSDVQGDKKIIDYLRVMGADIHVEDDKVTIKKSSLKGTTLDLNETPDALPVIAVLACFAEGKTHIVNVEHARIKETDRIKVMAHELKKMGANITETNDGLIIEKSTLHSAKLNGHHDHRIVMALSIAALCAKGDSEISTAESVSVTYPTFIEDMKSLGADFVIMDDL